MQSHNPPGGMALVAPSKYQRLLRTLLFASDFYTAIGVSKTATTQQIEDAFRQMQKIFDEKGQQNLSAEERERQAKLGEIQLTLTDAALRKEYDRRFEMKPAIAKKPWLPPVKANVRMFDAVPASAPLLISGEAKIQEEQVPEVSVHLERPPAFNPDSESVDEEKVQLHLRRQQALHKKPEQAVLPRPRVLTRAEELFLLFTNENITLEIFQNSQVTAKEMFSKTKYVDLDGRSKTLLALAKHHQRQELLNYCYEQAKKLPYRHSLQAKKGPKILFNDFGYAMPQVAVLCNQSPQVVEAWLTEIGIRC